MEILLNINFQKYEHLSYLENIRVTIVINLITLIFNYFFKYMQFKDPFF